MPPAVKLVAAVMLLSAPSVAVALVCSVCDFGARGDNRSDDSAAINAAIHQANCSAVVLTAPGMYLSKAIYLSGMSHRSFIVETGARLIQWREPATYGHVSFGGFIGPASGDTLVDFELTGGGIIDGSGQSWWHLGGDSRPMVLWLPNVGGAHIHDLTILDSSYWNMGLRGANVLVERINISSNLGSCSGYASAPNTDGFNIGGHNITVRDSWVHNGDDCVPVTTPGAHSFGSDVTTHDILVQNVSCECGTNGGVVYNSDGGKIFDVTFSNMTVTGTNQGGGAKIGRSTNNATGGIIRNITWENYKIVKPRNAGFYADVFGEDVAACRKPTKPTMPGMSGNDWLAIDELHFRNVTGVMEKTGQPAGCFLLTPGKPASGYTFENVVMVGAAPYTCFNMQPASGSGNTPVAPAFCKTSTAARRFTAQVRGSSVLQDKSAIPPGAKALGYTMAAINEAPTAIDIAPNGTRTGKYKWFSGQWYATPPSNSKYTTVDGVLALFLGGDLVSTAPGDMKGDGLLPLLSGRYGFYVEFEVKLSSNDPDHWPAVWLMPIEHNSRQEDSPAGGQRGDPGDPMKLERWMELDIDEGGFGPGLTGTVHNWTGVYPHYRNTQNGNNVVNATLNRTVYHIYGASYDPHTQTVAWWLDGKKLIETRKDVPTIAAHQNFYLIISCQSHLGVDTGDDYLMFVKAVRAFVPPSHSLEPQN